MGPIGSYWVLLGPIGYFWVLLGPVGKLFGNLESYSVHNQIHGLVPIELGALVATIDNFDLF